MFIFYLTWYLQRGTVTVTGTSASDRSGACCAGGSSALRVLHACTSCLKISTMLQASSARKKIGDSRFHGRSRVDKKFCAILQGGPGGGPSLCMQLMIRA